jgi:hypothetical protein
LAVAAATAAAAAAAAPAAPVQSDDGLSESDCDCIVCYEYTAETTPCCLRHLCLPCRYASRDSRDGRCIWCNRQTWVRDPDSASEVGSSETEELPDSQATTVRAEDVRFGIRTDPADDDPFTETSEAEDVEVQNARAFNEFFQEEQLTDETPEPPRQRQRIASPTRDMYQIFLRSATRQTLVMWVNSDTSILEIQHHIFTAFGWYFSDPRDLRLLIGTWQLESHRTLSDYNIREGATVHVLMRIRGGAEHFDVSTPPAVSEASGHLT